MPAYECSIALSVVAESPEEAARQAQVLIDENVEQWVFDVRDLESDDVQTIDVSELT